MNAAVFTDIPSNNQKSRVSSEGSPKLAISGLFMKKWILLLITIKPNIGQVVLVLFLADVKIDWKELILFFLGLAGAIASVVMSVIARQKLSKIILVMVMNIKACFYWHINSNYYCFRYGSCYFKHRWLFRASVRNSQNKKNKVEFFLFQRRYKSARKCFVPNHR